MSASDGLPERRVHLAGWGSKLCLIIVSVAFATLIGETVLRISGHFAPNQYPPQCGRPGYYEAYPPYGYRLIPSRRTTYRYPLTNPRQLSLVSNRNGFRAGRELDERDPRPRILFLGDSFVFGDGVEESERFTNVLESLRPSWRMDNLGMVGYGPDLMLRAFETVGLKLKPKLVLFCMYTDDFRRVRPDYAGTGFLIPRYTLESGRLVSVPYPKPHVWDRLSISVAARKVLWDYTDWQWDLNRAILDRFEDLAQKQAIAKAIIFLPGTSDTKNDRERRTWLKRYASGHATPFLDLSDAIHQLGNRAFIAGNPHLNPTGHNVIAREIDRFLRDRGLVLN